MTVTFDPLNRASEISNNIEQLEGQGKVKATADQTPDVKSTNPADIPRPTLAEPSMTYGGIDFSSFPALPSPGARMLDLVGSLMDEQRRANNEQRIQAAYATADQIRSQAEEMRSQAALNLGMGIVSGAISIGAGITSASMAGNALAKFGGDSGALALQNTKIQGISGAIGGFNDMFKAIQNFSSAQYDASIKEKDARIEELRAMRGQLDSIDQALKEVIAKARSSHDAIQQSMNQTRARILG